MSDRTELPCAHPVYIPHVSFLPIEDFDNAHDPRPVLLLGQFADGTPWLVSARYDDDYAPLSRWRGPANINIRALFGAPRYFAFVKVSL